MKIFYDCAHCGAGIDVVEVDAVDEAKFGFDCLTAEERQDIIKINLKENTMQVRSLCDNCIKELGLEKEPAAQQEMNFLH